MGSERWRRCGETGIPKKWNVNGTAILENTWQILGTLNLGLLDDSVVPDLHIDPRELEMYVHTKTCAWMFT